MRGQVPPAPRGGARRGWRARERDACPSAPSTTRWGKERMESEGYKASPRKSHPFGFFQTQHGSSSTNGLRPLLTNSFPPCNPTRKSAPRTWLKSSTRAPAAAPAKPKQCKSAWPRQQSNFSSLTCFITQQKETHIFGN